MPNSQRILVCDDDRFLSQSIVRLLQSQGYETQATHSGADAISEVKKTPPDLMILDLGLPDVDGVAVCRSLRSAHRFPILMLTSRSATADKVLGLEVGADDYLTKPFEGNELVARVLALLRRSGRYSEPATEVSSEAEVHVGPLSVREASRSASIHGAQLDLTETEFKVLAYLARNSGRALSRDVIFETVWGYDAQFNTNSLEVIMYRLRTKIADAGGPKMIHTLRGFGYKLELPD